MVQLGQVLNEKYRLVRLVGDGGMGAVYEAHHELLGTRVAIKVLHANMLLRVGLSERFLQEARVAAQIRSPNVVQIFDVDRTSDGTVYIVMELLEGEPLSAIMERERKLPVAVACEYTGQILLALEAAHALGVIHRDLKPENVFAIVVAGRPVLKLIDFGIAKLRQVDSTQNLTLAGATMGTAEYMAPEQAYSAGEVDIRADLYSVGVMLYEMLAGIRPVSGTDPRAIAFRVEQGEVTPIVHLVTDLPRELAGLVHRAMAPRPEQRFDSASQMRAALDRISGGSFRPSLAGNDKAPPRTMMSSPADGVFTSPPNVVGALRPPIPAPAYRPGGTAAPPVVAMPRVAQAVTVPRREKTPSLTWVVAFGFLFLAIVGSVVAIILSSNRGGGGRGEFRIPGAPTDSGSIRGRGAGDADGSA